ncbi:hypothetical protein C2E21_2092 [Chlorella sorokiniana]|uniref:Uncharacterized protein n=1 Tax=Chlorella sorokiniana TaxID=3076 RepID=A0A2P6TZ07_CHLSO|nr:hypothetical protein C2E21_2092 [Chlorella sorokiniana]|eukprot:PRW59302.1 hypothetical protein C2E21_2092 [Chlorella sorokiniana]
MLGKQERALARAAAAELEALRLVAGGWHDAAAAAAASAAKWRRRAGNMGRVAELALRHAAGPLSDPPLEGPASAAVGGIAAPLAAPEKAVTPEGAASGGAHIMQQASGSVGQQGVAGGSSSQRPGVQPSGSVSPAKGAAVVHAAMGLQQDDQQGSLDTSCSKPSVQFEEGLGGSSLAQARRSPDPQAAATACANPASRASSDERLQTALDRLEAQLARSKRQQAAAATVVADAHHRAASDMAGGICWLSGFGGGHRGSSP